MTVIKAEDMRPLIKEIIKEYVKENDKRNKIIERKYDKGAKVKRLLASYRRTKAALKNEVELSAE